MKKLLIITAMFSLSFGAFAQGVTQREMPSPEQRAERMTNRMAEQLGLDDGQKQKIYQLHLENAQIRQAEWETRKSEMEQRRGAMQEQRKQQIEEIEAILSPEQKIKWAEIRESNRKKGEKMRQNRREDRKSEYRKQHRRSFQGREAGHLNSKRNHRHSRS
ncbi:DUF4890 domain-containing protein [Cecembia rubra]|uniref:Spy/CpxP family protein refolding chaperone n=1 Tax=Cecembia rubra TaxID=1485585 RepID=A0A2P8DTC5_9BACT|nr:DUF4890 domain-containing protein [Cecembia rubra]PSL00449.1 hypothetical protein CLV48_1151 [Cecembia rubra]